MADYGIELLIKCGIESVTAVVCPNDVEAFDRLLAPSGCRLSFAVQPEPLGTADALERCADIVDEPYVATLWGDNLFELVPQPTVAKFLADPTACMITVASSPSPEHFSTVTVVDDRVTAIVDKPAHPTTNRVCAGFMLFDSAALFRSVDKVSQNRRGEREAMDTVREFLRTGHLAFDRVQGQWFDAAVSPQYLTDAERFALTRGFNHAAHTREEALTWI
jgi:glucose-1-phosphate thymidylyltransferase